MSENMQDKYYSFVDMKENQQQLRGMQAAAYPHMKRKSGSNLFKTVEKLCFPDFVREGQAQETTALKDFMDGLK